MNLLDAKFLFASLIGRIGASLDDGKSAARSTKYLGLLLLIVVGLFFSASLVPTNFLVGQTLAEASTETNKDIVVPFWTSTVQPLFAKLGDYQAVITPGLADKVKAASIYKAERFSDHAPLTMDYDYTL